MATYYLKLAADGGNDSLAGTSPSTAWATWAKALGATGITGGDILYVAPGVYNVTSTVTVGGTYSSTAQIIGDTTSAQFPGVNPGLVVLTGWNAAKTSYSLGTNAVISASGKSNLTFKSINFNTSGNTFSLTFTTAQNIAFEDCIFTNAYNSQTMMRLSNTGGALNASIKRCVFAGGANGINIVGNNVSDTSTIQSSIFTGFLNDVIVLSNCGLSIYNCTFINNRFGVNMTGVSSSFPVRIYNCMFANADIGIFANVGSSTTEDYNRICNVASPRTNVSNPGANTTTTTPPDLEFFQVYKSGLNFPAFFGNTQNNINKSFGTSTGAPATDLFGVAWTGTTPDAGAITYNPINLVAPTLVYNGGNDRNASTITIAPGSTSQSIELYLGATGLTASTSGLSARYNRTRTASVSIPLVARTIAQAWTSGGFAEVDATNMPGVYRLDVPDAALAAGADDVTIVVRGASGTNGAVMTIKLSSGGLTSAQTASAVWGASPAGYNDATTFGGVVNQIDQTVTGTSVLVQDVPSNVWQEQTDDHTTHGTFGYNILRADAPSKEGLVTLHQSGGISRVDADIHAIVNDTLAAAELKGALLHTGGDYISADLLTPVTSAQTVRIGPFAVRTDAGGADGALDLNQSTAGAVVVQLTDAQGTGIDQTSATVQAKVYNVAGGLVATYTCTPAYAVNGFVSIPMTTAVTGTAGSYIINLWSTVGATVIIYGPLQLRVRAI